MHDRQFQFDWNEVKAAANALKHGVSFDLARTIFNDPFLVTVADLEHSETEERWFSIGRAANCSLLSVAYLWSEVESAKRFELSLRVKQRRRKSVNMKRAYEQAKAG